MPLDPHAARYMFGFSTMPSVPAYGTSCVFVDGAGDYEAFYDCFLQEIKGVPSLTPSIKVRTYYKTIDTPDLSQFVKWVMERENLSPVDSIEEYPDTIEEYLNGEHKQSFKETQL